MADGRLYVHVLLDRSGSMEDCRDKTIDAFNEYVNSLKQLRHGGARLSLTTFDSESVELVFDALRIGDVPKLTRDTFVPRGRTPLFDALGQVVAHIDKVNMLADERVALAVLTDGLENASTEYRAETVRKLLSDRQERKNWLVLYLGANQDAWAAGEQIGAAKAHAMAFDTGHIGAAMQSVAASIGRYRAAPASVARKEAAFTKGERQRSMGRPDSEEV
jgi:Mg-chelatase subunit ChlD